MARLTRGARFTALTLGAILFWGASTACETDSWSSDSRVAVAPASAPAGLPDAPGGATAADLGRQVLEHRALYARYLQILANFYSERGYENKARWARAELRDLKTVRPISYVPDNTPAPAERNAPVMDIMNPPDVQLRPIRAVGREEVDLVEEMLLEREAYLRSLKLLIDTYARQGEENQAAAARSELNDNNAVKRYAYITEAETPSAPLKPLESIAEADQLYREAYDLMIKGGHHVAIWYNATTMRIAVNKFKDLIDRYPTSDKIASAAYYIAEIHKEYNQERDNEIAIEWYKKAIAWDPNVNHPCWSHIAHIYDFRMHEREKALEWYQKVLDNEKDKTGHQFAGNINFATRRIRQLTKEETRHSPGEPAEQEPAPVPPPASPGGDSGSGSGGSASTGSSNGGASANGATNNGSSPGGSAGGSNNSNGTGTKRVLVP